MVVRFSRESRSSGNLKVMGAELRSSQKFRSQVKIMFGGGSQGRSVVISKQSCSDKANQFFIGGFV